MKKRMTMTMLAAGLFVAQAMVPGATPEAQAGGNQCHAAARKVAYDYKGSKNWSGANLNRLCGRVQTPQPANCFKKVMHGGVSWGQSTKWKWGNALKLCAGSTNANQTVSCFKAFQPKVGWKKAIDICKAGANRPNGAPCSHFKDCASATCDAGRGTRNTNLCVPPRRTGKVGDFCTDDMYCQSKLCDQKTRKCTNRKKPQPKPKHGLGQKCHDRTDCRSDTCDKGRGTGKTYLCVPKRGTGNPGTFCTDGIYCRSKRCDRQTRKCLAPPKPPKQPKLKKNGDRCGHYRECESQTCDAGPGTGKTELCVPKRGTGNRGAFCTSNIYCRSGNCNLQHRKCN